MERTERLVNGDLARRATPASASRNRRARHRIGDRYPGLGLGQPDVSSRSPGTKTSSSRREPAGGITQAAAITVTNLSATSLNADHPHEHGSTGVSTLAGGPTSNAGLVNFSFVDSTPPEIDRSTAPTASKNDRRRLARRPSRWDLGRPRLTFVESRRSRAAGTDHA